MDNPKDVERFRADVAELAKGYEDGRFPPASVIKVASEDGQDLQISKEKIIEIAGPLIRKCGDAVIRVLDQIQTASREEREEKLTALGIRPNPAASSKTPSPAPQVPSSPGRLVDASGRTYSQDRQTGSYNPVKSGPLDQPVRGTPPSTAGPMPPQPERDIFGQVRTGSDGQPLYRQPPGQLPPSPSSPAATHMLDLPPEYFGPIIT